MSWNQSSSSHFPQASCSFTSPANEDVKPNIHLLAPIETSTCSARPLHTVDIKQPPPGFSQSCNHKILLSKSFDCKTGTTQVANLPNVSNPSNAIRANPPQTPNGLPNFNHPPPSNPNFFKSTNQRLPREPDVPLYRGSFSQIDIRPVMPPAQGLGNGEIYGSTNVRSSTNQVNGLTNAYPKPLHSMWQQPPPTPLPFFNSSQPQSPVVPPSSFSTQTSYNPPLLLPQLNLPPPLPQLNLPPPTFIPNHRSTSNTTQHIEPFNSMNHINSKIQINGNSRRVPQSTSTGISHTIHPRIFSESDQQNMYSSNNTMNEFPQTNVSNFVPRTSSTKFPISFNIPPPSFTVPPPPTPQYQSHAMPSIAQIKTEKPNSCCVDNSDSTLIGQFSLPVLNGGATYDCSDRTITPPVKRPRSRDRQSCDYQTIDQYSNNPHKKTPSIRSDTNVSQNQTNEKYNRDSRANNGSYHTRSRSPSTVSGRTDRPDPRPHNNYIQSESSSSSRRSPSKNIARSRSHYETKPHNFRRSSSRTRHLSSRSRCSSRSKDTLTKSKRSRSRSRSRQEQSQSKRMCTRRRSRSRSPHRANDSNRSRTRRSTSRSRSDQKYSRHEKSKLSPTRKMREVTRERQIRRSKSRSPSKARPRGSRPARKSRSKSKSPSSVRGTLSTLDKWRMNNCSSEREMTEKFNALAAMEADQIIEEEKKIWTRSAPADLYYTKHSGDEAYECTQKTRTICDQFENVIQNFVSAKALKKPFDYTANRKKIKRKCSHCASHTNVSSDSESSGSSSGEENAEEDNWMLELQLKQNHPDRLHPELWFNDKGEMNDGPLCRCSTKSRRSGIRHNIYAGEEQQAYCNPDTNNPDKLYHYRVTVSPPTNFLINKPTVIEHDNQEFIFEGFSLFSHHPLEKLPTCRVIRFNIQYTIVYIEEKVPNGFCVRDTELFFNYLFHEVLELVDLDLKSANDNTGCPQFHIMPRFVRELKDNGKELLPMYRVLEYFTSSFEPVISEELARTKGELSTFEWQDFADGVKGMIVVKPGAKPCAMRVDQLDRESETKDIYPDSVHFGSRPLQLCFAGSPDFQKLWKGYVKLRHLVANKPKRTAEDKRRLAAKEQRLQEMRTNSKMKRGVTVAISSRGFYRTGIMCDMVQHAMLIPVLICHLRFHRSLNVLENKIEYKFKNRYLLQLALTHPSYRENFGTNPDHARNSLSNCGVRQPEYGDRRIHFQNTRKRGINTLINIMSKLGRKVATESNITHNERLEFLGDAVVEFITSIHLFHVFSDIEEGGLATYRAAIVQNQHLAHLAKKIGLEDFMLYAHGSDLCHEVELKHAMANCFEALMGALFLDGGIQVADKVFSSVLYKDNELRFNQWMNYPQHPLQEQEPDGDRQWVKQSPLLKKLQYLEFSSGVIFNHIRLLARVFTTRSMGYTNLTMGSNQRLEFLGDTVLQLITSDYLYNHFPEHHEGHLSLLRSSLVNNRTQSVVCNDICMPFFANLINPKIDLKMKDRADLLEAFLGAMYIDKGMEACEQFCKVCFFPRLQYFILNQEWNDPKSKLQQCCLTLRTLDGGEPDIPIYKVIEHVGPTNSRSYTVAVYFKNERLAKATGNSIQQAEMNAAKVALQKCPSICPQLDHQKRVIAKSLEIQKHEGLLTETKHEHVQTKMNIQNTNMKHL